MVGVARGSFVKNYTAIRGSSEVKDTIDVRVSIVEMRLGLC